MVGAEVDEDGQTTQSIADTRLLGQSRDCDENLFVQSGCAFVTAGTPRSNTLLLGNEGWSLARFSGIGQTFPASAGALRADVEVLGGA
jgi:hypothetical protein